MTITWTGSTGSTGSENYLDFGILASLTMDLLIDDEEVFVLGARESLCYNVQDV